MENNEVIRPLLRVLSILCSCHQRLPTTEAIHYWINIVLIFTWLQWC